MSKTESTPADANPPTARSPRIFISAAEPSGDLHAAALIREIRTLCPEARFFGVAGPRMRAAGCEGIDDLTVRSAMLLGALRLAGHAWRLVRRVQRMLRQDGADLVILTDSPALHLGMAKRAKAAGCPILYYIAPQLWAWAPWRVRRVRRYVDRLAAILPFEEDYFRERGVNARYVGHPLIEQLANAPRDEALVDELRASGRPVIACLPGSRSHVIQEVLPGQIEVCRAIAEHHPKASFVFAAAGETAGEMISRTISEESERVSGCACAKHPKGRSGKSILTPFSARVELGRNTEILAAADLALVASGTATLEVACRGVPMVIMYNGSKWGYRLVGRWLIQTPHLSLVNILAGRAIVPEFMPYYTSTEPIATEALDLLNNDARRARMQADLDQIVRSLGTANAAAKTARIAMEMIGK